MTAGIVATCSISDERLITTEGTIIPQAVRFADGRLLVSYSLGNDAWFTPCGMQVSEDDGVTWKRTLCPMDRIAALGPTAEADTLLFDQYLWRVGDNEFAAYHCKATENGARFSPPRLAHFHVEGVLARHYVPRPADDPDHFVEPAIPDFYSEVVSHREPIVGGHIFGSVIRLPDGALGLSAYCRMQGNTRRKAPPSADYVGIRPDAGVAEEATDDVLWSSLFFRSEDGGETWHATSTIAKAEEDFPFDAGVLYSEGFTETGLACTSDGRVYALLRHGSYMLMWRFISCDGGRTWGEPLCFNYPGVAPSLCLMPGGILAAAWGRPGMTVGFSLDGTGRTWDLLAGVMQDDVPSQKYPWIVPIAEDRIMLLYDKRKWDSERRVFYDHGIYCREIMVKREG